MAYLLHQLLTDSARRFPEREAARFNGQALSYAELDRRSNQVARALRAMGVARGDRVGLLLHKSLASVVAVFGVMKAGAAYVPLDPAAPPKRLAYIMRNCGVRALLTAPMKTALLAPLVEGGASLRAALLMEDLPFEREGLPRGVELITWPWARTLSDKAVPNDAIESDLAYILYTSGSTGDPKGVMISHRTIMTFIDWCHEKFQVAPYDRVTSHAPLHFDLSTFDLYVTIKAGGTVVLVPEKLSVFPVQLVRLLQEEQVTITYLVPSILSLMVNYGHLARHDLSSLRTVLFAGEVFPIKYLRQLVRALPQCDFYNLYGPTETNVCTYYQVQPEDTAPDRIEPVPIGVACENMEVFAVRDDGELVEKPGEEGELWVRGPCLAYGYWGDSERSARAFVPNPFQPHWEERAYRTGDIVALDEDGVNWRYRGRRDHMIKSRGYRIELGEIEAALYSHPGVQEAAAVAIPDELVGNRIKAYVVPLNGNGLDAQAIRAHCRARLPDYMIPEQVELWEALPKTSTGKVNRPLLAAARGPLAHQGATIHE